jgi:anthranilate phosphoribosyltransferase
MQNPANARAPAGTAAILSEKPRRGRLLELLTAPDLAPALAGALLAALRAKGVTAAELRGFAGAMRALARKPALPADLDAIDIVGTGGDSSGSLNLSTGAALLAAACGLPVVKHGNRSVTSRSGSADLIEQLGLRAAAR